MTTEPVLEKTTLMACLRSSYGISARDLRFLPLGSDVRSFSYQCASEDGEFFLKLRLPDTIATLDRRIPLFVMNALQSAIRPLVNRATGEFATEYGAYQLSVFPYIEGVSGWNYSLSPDQWKEVGRSLRQLHDISLPEPMLEAVPRETFSSFWRTRALDYLNVRRSSWPADPSATTLMELLRAKRRILLDIVERARVLAEKLNTQTFPLSCCHGDIHSGNFLIDRQGKIYPVDWDTLSLAPKEKDLMFIEAGIGGMLDAAGGTALFYQGYGQIDVNQDALNYYRFERIVQDVVAYREQLLDTAEGGEDRAVMIEQLVGQFERGGPIDVAYLTAPPG